MSVLTYDQFNAFLLKKKYYFHEEKKKSTDLKLLKGINRLNPVWFLYTTFMRLPTIKSYYKELSETQTRDAPVTDPPSIHFVVSLARVLFPLL